MASAQDLQATLNNLGLGFLFDTLKNIVQDTTLDAKNRDEVGLAIEANPDPAIREAYDKRFSGNKLREAAGMRPLKPSEYIQAERQYIDTLRNTGLPVGFYDQQPDLAKFIGSDISVVELQNRVVRGYRAAAQADPETKAQLQALYGIDEADLAAYYLDPSKATDVLNRKKDAQLFGTQISSAKISAQAQTQAGIRLNIQQAEELAARNIEPSTAQQGFQQIARSQGLFAGAQAGEDAISQAEQIAGTFGTSEEAAQRIATRRRRRQAQFESGGGFAQAQGGVSGLRTVGQ